MTATPPVASKTAPPPATAAATRRSANASASRMADSDASADGKEAASAAETMASNLVAANLAAMMIAQAPPPAPASATPDLSGQQTPAAQSPAPQPGAAPAIPGLEWSGQVAAVGARVTGHKPGDWVMCNAQGGAYAEYAVADMGRAWGFDPKEIDAQQAAVLPLALLTCHDALVTQGGLRRGGNVLVNGASSGIGIAMMLCARELGAVLIAGTSRDPVKQKELPKFGCTHVLVNLNAGGLIARRTEEQDLILKHQPLLNAQHLKRTKPRPARNGYYPSGW